MLGEATAAAWRSALASLCSGFATAMAVLYPLPPVRSARGLRLARGVGRSRRLQPRLARVLGRNHRAVQRYVLRRPAPACGNRLWRVQLHRRAQRQAVFQARTGFADALIGYLNRAGPLTTKAFVGISAIEHDVASLRSAEPRAGPRIWAPKSWSEFWLNMGEILVVVHGSFRWTSAHADVCRPHAHRLPGLR